MLSISVLCYMVSWTQKAETEMPKQVRVYLLKNCNICKFLSLLNFHRFIITYKYCLIKKLLQAFTYLTYKIQTTLSFVPKFSVTKTLISENLNKILFAFVFLLRNRQIKQEKNNIITLKQQCKSVNLDTTNIILIS